MLRPNVPLTFVNADVAKDQVMALVHARADRPAAIVLDIGATADFDVATTDMLAALHADLGEAGIELRLSQVRGSVRDRMRRTGLMATIGEDHCFLSDEAAVAAPLPTRPATPAADTGVVAGEPPPDAPGA
jgi:SulP family sulfate permease